MGELSRRKRQRPKWKMKLGHPDAFNTPYPFGVVGAMPGKESSVCWVGSTPSEPVAI